MGFFNGVRSIISNLEKSMEASGIATVKRDLMRHAISCHCGSMAVPVPDTINRYCCVKCQRRFAHSKHNIHCVINTEYQNAIKEIRRQYG